MKSVRSISTKLLFLILMFLSFSACSQDLIYINEEYGFKIIFLSDIWKEYKIYKQLTDRGNNIRIPTFYILLPTEDTDWYSVLEDGYAPVFAISAFTVEQWELVKALEGEMFMEVETGRNNKYIFSNSHAHASPADLMSIFFNSDYKIDIFNIE